MSQSIMSRLRNICKVLHPNLIFLNKTSTLQYNKIFDVV